MKKKLFGNYDIQDLKDFYIFDKPNPNGVTLQGIWLLTDEEYENNHNFIQWMFPITDLSLHNLYAPRLNKEIIEELKSDDDIIMNIQMSYIVYLNYLGIAYDEEQKRYVIGIDFDNRKKLWLTKNNHNFKRITRCLKCLRLFSLDNFAQAFIDVLKDIDKSNPGIITKKEWKYWK